jgi:hypothetical protein
MRIAWLTVVSAASVLCSLTACGGTSDCNACGFNPGEPDGSDANDAPYDANDIEDVSFRSDAGTRDERTDAADDGHGLLDAPVDASREARSGDAAPE